MSARGLLKAAQKELGLDDETYRARLQRETGKTSSTEMSEKEIQRCLESFKKDGFKPTMKSAGRRLEGKYASKLQALWIAGYNLGLIRNKEDRALLSFVKRQTGIDHVRFLYDDRDAFKVIEALKAWLAKKGGVDWSIDGFSSEYERSYGFKIARAQFGKLYAETPELYSVLWPVFCDEIFMITRTRNFDDLSAQQWIHVMNFFGKRLRERLDG